MIVRDEVELGLSVVLVDPLTTTVTVVLALEVVAAEVELAEEELAAWPPVREKLGVS